MMVPKSMDRHAKNPTSEGIQAKFSRIREYKIK